MSKNVAARQVTGHSHYFLAGHITMTPEYERRLYEEAGYKNRLLTWAYMGGANSRQLPLFEEWKKIRKQDPEVSIMIDSGAFTFCNAKVAGGLDPDDFVAYEAKVDQYIEFLKTHLDDIDLYFALDHIWYWDKSIEYYDKMRAAGLNPIPVFHGADPWEVLEYYAEKTDYIAIATQGMPKPQKYAFLSKVFSQYPDHKFHGLAVGGSARVYTDFPFVTCDSSAWTRRSVDGTMLIPKGFGSKRKVYLTVPSVVATNPEEHTVHKENLDGEVVSKTVVRRQPNYNDIGPHEQERINDFLDFINVSYEDLAGKDGTGTGIKFQENRSIAYLKALKIEMEGNLKKTTSVAARDLPTQTALFGLMDD